MRRCAVYVVELRKLAWNGIPDEFRPVAWQLLHVCLYSLAFCLKPTCSLGLSPPCRLHSQRGIGSQAQGIHFTGRHHISERPRRTRSANMASNRDRCAKDSTWY